MSMGLSRSGRIYLKTGLCVVKTNMYVPIRMQESFGRISLKTGISAGFGGDLCPSVLS